MSTSLLISEGKGKRVVASYITGIFLVISIYLNGDYSSLFGSNGQNPTLNLSNIFTLFSFTSILAVIFLIIDIDNNLDRLIISYLSRIFSPYPNATYIQARKFHFLETKRDQLYGTLFFLIEGLVFFIWIMFFLQIRDLLFLGVIIIILFILLIYSLILLNEYKSQLHIIWKYLTLSGLRDRPKIIENRLNSAYSAIKIKDWIIAKNILDSIDYEIYNKLILLQDIKDSFYVKIGHIKKSCLSISDLLDDLTKNDNWSEVIGKRKSILKEIEAHSIKHTFRLEKDDNQLNNELKESDQFLLGRGYIFLQTSGYRLRYKLWKVIKGLRTRKIVFLYPKEDFLGINNINRFIEQIKEYRNVIIQIDRRLIELVIALESPDSIDKFLQDIYREYNEKPKNDKFAKAYTKLLKISGKLGLIQDLFKQFILLNCYDEEKIKRLEYLFRSHSNLGLTEDDWNDVDNYFQIVNKQNQKNTISSFFPIFNFFVSTGTRDDSEKLKTVINSIETFFTEIKFELGLKSAIDRIKRNLVQYIAQQTLNNLS